MQEELMVTAMHRGVLSIWLNKTSLCCNGCGTKQIQLVSYNQKKMAGWKCRHCSSMFSWGEVNWMHLVAMWHLTDLARENAQPMQSNRDQTSLPHLAWMMEQIVQNKLSDDLQVATWIGFVQGVLVSKELTTVEAMRNRTRMIKQYVEISL